MKKIITRMMWNVENVIAVMSFFLIGLLIILVNQHSKEIGTTFVVMLNFMIFMGISVSVWVLGDTIKEIINDYNFKQEIAKNFLFENNNDNEYNTIVNKFNNSVINKVQDATWVSWIMKDQLENELGQIKKELYQLERNRKNHEFLMQFYA